MKDFWGEGGGLTDLARILLAQFKVIRLHSNHSGSDQSESNHSGSDQSESNHSGSDQSESNHSGSDQSESNHSGSDQSESPEELLAVVDVVEVCP